MRRVATGLPSTCLTTAGIGVGAVIRPCTGAPFLTVGALGVGLGIAAFTASAVHGTRGHHRHRAHPPGRAAAGSGAADGEDATVCEDLTWLAIWGSRELPRVGLLFFGWGWGNLCTEFGAGAALVVGVRIVRIVCAVEQGVGRPAFSGLRFSRILCREV
jgi:hypothetical protein